MRPEDPWTAQSRARRRGRIVKLDMRKQAERNSNIALPETRQLAPQISKNPSRLRLLVMEGFDLLTGEIIPRFKPTTDVQAMQKKLDESKQGVFDAALVTFIGGSVTALSAVATGPELGGEAGLAVLGLTGVTALVGYRLLKFSENVRLYSGYLDTLQPVEAPKPKLDTIGPFPQVEQQISILQDPAASLEHKVEQRSLLVSLRDRLTDAIEGWKPSQGIATRPQIKPSISKGPSHD